MLRINNNDYNRILEYVKANGRLLDYYLIMNLKKDMSFEIISELRKYQNEDGGFGNALEPDLRVPNSSAVATEFAINILQQLNNPDGEMIFKIIRYLENTYSKEKGYWEIAPKEVDDYPRAIWWNYSDIESFGPLNPTATFAGFLYKYKDKTNFSDMLLDHVVNIIIKTPIEDIEAHALLCCNRLLSYVPQEIAQLIEDKINKTIEHVIELDPKKWDEYSPEPVKYITSKDHPLYNKYTDDIESNLDYLISTINDDGVWNVKHSWFQFVDVFELIAKKDWTSYFTYENLLTLKRFNRLSD